MRKLVSAITLAVTLTAVTTTTGCTQTKAAATVVKTDALDCLKQDLGTQVSWAGGLMSVAFAVAGIIFAGDATLDSDIAKLEAKYGTPLVACAAKYAKDLFATAPTLSTGDAVEMPSDRAAALIARRGWTFAK